MSIAATTTSTEPGSTEPVRIVDDPDDAGVLLHPMRARLLDALSAPQSATGLARELDMPRQKVNYHLRELERAGFVELVEERRRRNCTERIVQATARSYIINPEIIAALGTDPETVRDRFSSSYLVALASRIIKDVAVLRRRADAVDQKLATLSMAADVRFKSPDDRAAFAEGLAQAFAQLISTYHDDTAPDGRSFRFVIGAHPVITKTEEEAQAEADAHRTRQNTKE